MGGDYYDFLDLGQGRVVLVLADISGKGISAALLMANLQANLRSQYALALNDLSALLKAVNRLFHESTSPQHYATLFFGSYDDTTRRLSYINCGHTPPLLLRANGQVEWLEATATVLGIFDVWDCTVGEVMLAPDDTLLVCSDGVTEARSDEGEEFGQERLVTMLQSHHHLSLDALPDAIVTTVQEFSGREQEDDLTLVLARGR